MSDKTGQSQLKLGDVTVTFPLVAAEHMYEELKRVLDGGALTQQNVVKVLISLMQAVESYQGLSGTQKKAIILDAINHVIDDQMEEGAAREQFKLVVELTLPSVIDTIVSFDRNEMAIRGKKCLASFFACVGAQKTVV